MIVQLPSYLNPLIVHLVSGTTFAHTGENVCGHVHNLQWQHSPYSVTPTMNNNYIIYYNSFTVLLDHFTMVTADW